MPFCTMHSMFNRRYRDYIWLVLIKFNTFPSGWKDSSASAKVFPSRLTCNEPSEGKPLPWRHGQEGRGETTHILAGGFMPGFADRTRPQGLSLLHCALQQSGQRLPNIPLSHSAPFPKSRMEWGKYQVSMRACQDAAGQGPRGRQWVYEHLRSGMWAGV